jgi:uncharacterized membrane protein YesL
MKKKIAALPVFWNTLKSSFGQFYYSMGFSFFISMMWFVIYLPIFLIFFMIFPMLFSKISAQGFIATIASFLVVATVWNGFVAGPVTTTFYGLYRKREEEDDFVLGFSTFLQILKSNYWHAIAVHGSFALAVSLLIMNILIGVFNHQPMLLVTTTVAAYFLILLLLMAFYINPLILLGNGFKKVWRKSFLLTMDNLNLSILLGVILGITLLFCFLFIFLLPFFYGAIMFYIIGNGFEPIYDRYE